MSTDTRKPFAAMRDASFLDCPGRARRYHVAVWSGYIAIRGGAAGWAAGRYGWPEEKTAKLREMRGVIARWSR